MVYEELTNDVYANRDAQTATDVATMAELGRFGGQFIVYGTAMQMLDGQIQYRVTADEKKLEAYIAAQQLNGVYCTPTVSFQKRTQVPAGMEDKLLLASKYTLLGQMKRDYESVDYFSHMAPFFAVEAANTSYPLLCQYRNKIDGNFDDLELQLFTGAVRMAYESKILDRAHYDALMQWHQHTRVQMDDDPVVEDNLGRTLYGFVYWKNGRADCIFDAQEIGVIRQRRDKLLQGYTVGPIIKRDYWFQQFHQFKEIRKQHEAWLLRSENEAFYRMLHTMRQLPGVIDTVALEQVKQAVRKSEHALCAVNYYDAQWNKK